MSHISYRKKSPGSRDYHTDKTHANVLFLVPLGGMPRWQIAVIVSSSLTFIQHFPLDIRLAIFKCALIMNRFVKPEYDWAWLIEWEWCKTFLELMVRRFIKKIKFRRTKGILSFLGPTEDVARALCMYPQTREFVYAVEPFNILPLRISRQCREHIPMTVENESNADTSHAWLGVPLWFTAHSI